MRSVNLLYFFKRRVNFRFHTSDKSTSSSFLPFFFYEKIIFDPDPPYFHYCLLIQDNKAAFSSSYSIGNWCSFCSFIYFVVFFCFFVVWDSSQCQTIFLKFELSSSHVSLQLLSLLFAGFSMAQNVSLSLKKFWCV